jgi:hypothetical protein
MLTINARAKDHFVYIAEGQKFCSCFTPKNAARPPHPKFHIQKGTHMETANAIQRQLMQDAMTLRCLVEQEQDEDADGVDLLLLTLLDTFIRDMQYQLGDIECPYSDDLQRLIFLKQILRSADKILDRMAIHANGEPLPPAAKGLCKILFDITFSVFLVIHGLEERNPEHAEYFAADRLAYAASREIAQ